MSDRRPGDEPPTRPVTGRSGPERAEDAALASRLGRLAQSIDEKRGPAQPGGRSPSAEASQGWAYAMRISSEFIAGIIVGGGIGWGLDWVTGWSPFGLAVFLMLGFAAGVLNVLRGIGKVSEPGGRKGGPDDGPGGKK